MGLLSTLGSIAGVAAAPFTGGLSLIPSAIGLGTDIVGGITGTKASNAAAAAQMQSINQAKGYLANGLQDSTGTLRGGQQQAYDAQLGALNANSQLNEPAITTGNQALYSINGMMQNGGLQNPNYTAPSYAATAYSFDPSKDVSAFLDPSISYAMQALQRSQAGKSRLMSGGSVKELGNYLQATGWNNAEQAAERNAKTVYDTSHQNAMDTYNTGQQNALNTYNAGRQNVQDQYSRLYGIADMGQAAAGRQQSANTNFGNQVQNLDENTAQQIGRNQLSIAGSMGDLTTQGGNVQAARYGRNASILNTTLANAGQSVGNMISMRNAQKNSNGTLSSALNN